VSTGKYLPTFRRNFNPEPGGTIDKYSKIMTQIKATPIKLQLDLVTF
jgi:hypothetical protein